MGAADLRALERAFRTAPDDPTARDALVAACRRDGRDPPQAAVARLPRWQGLVDHVARFHHRPIKPEDGVPPAVLDAAERRLGRPLPLAVREWYLLVGARPEVLGGRQDSPVPADEVTLSDGLLTLYVENQGVIHWGVRAQDLDLEDPPVHDREGIGRPWNGTASQFCWQMAVYQQAVAGPARFGAIGFGKDGAARLDGEVERHYPRLPLPTWPWSGSEEAFVLFGDDDTIVVLETGGSIVFVVAASAPALTRARQRLAASCDWGGAR